jgi:hypothetical protein
VAGIIVLLFTGCAAPWKNPPSLIDQPANVTSVNLPPREALNSVKQTLASMSLPIDREQGGTIYTGYQPFPGEWHVLRRWQERTRYRIDVTPDFDQPAQKSTIEVREETETRAASNQDFERDLEIRRPERAKALLDKIRVAAGSAPATNQ